MVLKLTQQQQQQIYRHAEQTYPEECCGILLGTFDQQGTSTVREVWETENVWENHSDQFESVFAEARQEGESQRSSKGDRFTIAPEMLLKAQKYARDQKIDIIGIYHSHPDHPARPSEFDRAIAWEAYSYLIMSVQQGTVVDCCSWVLDNQQQFQKEIIVTEGCHEAK